MLSSSSSLGTVSKLRLVIGHRVVPIGTSHLWLLRVWTHHSSASVHLPLLVGARSGIVVAFCLYIIRVKALGQVVQSLLRKGAFELAPLSLLGYYSRLFFYHEGLGVVAAGIKSLAFVCKLHHPEGSVSAFSDASVFRIVSSVHGVRQSLPILGFLLGSLHRSSRGSWLRFGVFSTVLDSASALSARLANSGVLPRVDSSFSEDVPPVVQFSRNSRRLGEVSACGVSGVFSSSESYWTLSVSGLLHPGNESTSFSLLASCFYHEWIYLDFLARVDEDAVLSDSGHSGGMAADAVVPVALHRPWVRLDSEALVRWSSEIRQDLFWWWGHERLELVS